MSLSLPFQIIFFQKEIRLVVTTRDGVIYWEGTGGVCWRNVECVFFDVGEVTLTCLRFANSLSSDLCTSVNIFNFK